MSAMDLVTGLLGASEVTVTLTVTLWLCNLVRIAVLGLVVAVGDVRVALDQEKV